MWWCMTVVVIASCVVSSVVSMVRLEDGISTEDSLQDLTTRTKKSPVPDNFNKTIGMTPSDSKSSAEMVNILSEDIRKKLQDLKNFKRAYTNLEDDFLGSDKKSNESLLEEIEVKLLKSEDENPIVEKITSDESITGDESLRITRQNYNKNPIMEYKIINYPPEGDAFPEIHGAYPLERVSGHDLNSYYNRDAYVAKERPYLRTVENGAIEGEVHGEVHVQPVTTQVTTNQAHLIKIKQLLPGIISGLSALVRPFQTVSPQSAVPVVVRPIQTHIRPSVSVHNKPEAVINTVTPAVSQHVGTGSTKPPGFFFSKQLIFGMGTDDKLDGSHHHQEVSGAVHHGQGQYYYIPVITPSPVFSPYISPPYYSGGYGYGYGGLDYPYTYSSYPGPYSNYGSPYSAGYGYPYDQYGYGYSPYQQGHSLDDTANPSPAPDSFSPSEEQNPFPASRNAPEKPYLRYAKTDSPDLMRANGQDSVGFNSEIGQLKLAIEAEQEKVKLLKQEMKTIPDSDKKQGVSKEGDKMELKSDLGKKMEENSSYR